MSDINVNWLIENFGGTLMTVFDIGCADITGDSKMFKTCLPKATVYAFDCAETYKEHNLRYAAELGIRYFHCAMSDENGTSTYYPSDQFNGEYHPYSGSVCKPIKTEIEVGVFVWGEPYTVETIRIDTFCDTYNVTPNFIHIDVQGAEFKVLSNLGKHRPWAIWAEVNEFEGCYETSVTYLDFRHMLTELGYTRIYSNNVDELFVLTELKVTPYTVKTVTDV